MAQKKNTKTSKAKKTKEVNQDVEVSEAGTVEKPSKTASNVSFGNRW